MGCSNMEKAIRAKSTALEKMEKRDFPGARKFAVKAQKLDPDLEDIVQMILVCDVHCSDAEKMARQDDERDWYKILNIEPTADEASVRKQYNKMALSLHPDKNRFPGAAEAFQLINQAKDPGFARFQNGPGLSPFGCFANKRMGDDEAEIVRAEKLSKYTKPVSFASHGIDTQGNESDKFACQPKENGKRLKKRSKFSGDQSLPNKKKQKIAKEMENNGAPVYRSENPGRINHPFPGKSQNPGAPVDKSENPGNINHQFPGKSQNPGRPVYRSENPGNINHLFPGNLEILEYSDSELNDFEKGMAKKIFSSGQIWAVYDTLDAMPRFYALINNVISGDFKLQITWLEPYPDNEEEKKWLYQGLPASCGKFKLGESEIIEDHAIFSHLVNWRKGINLINEAIKCTVEFVEVLSDYCCDGGVSVAFLGKIKGFSTLFSRISGEELIPVKDKFRFSHRVPSFRMTSNEGPNGESSESRWETQVVDLGGETQVLDDLDCMKDMPIEFLNEFYNEDAAVSKCEGAINTQAFCETQELSQDDSEKIDGSDSVGLESTVDDHPARQGSLFRGFTSIRAASIRASGLAARERGANRNSYPTSSDKSSLEQQTRKKDGPSLSGCLLESGLKNDLECLQNEYNEDGEELRNSNKCKVASAAVRKLFKDDEVGQSGAEINRPDDNIDMPDVLASENCLAGLSYANSQEPGELSQAHALEVVDKFLDLNAIDIDEGFGKIVQNVERPKVVSVQKQRFLTEPRKPRCSNLKSVKAVKSNGDEKEQKCTKNRSGHSVYSDSGLMLHKLRAKGKPLYCGEEVIRKNLMKDLNEQLNVETGLKLVEKDTNKDVQDMKDIGPDTQIAVEAMETLCFEVNLTDGNGNDPDKGAHSTAKATKKNQLSNCPARSEECLTRKRPYHTSVGVVTRQAKQIKRTPIRASDKSSLSPKQSKKIRKRNDTVLQEAEQRGPTDVTVSAYHGTKSTGQRSEKMRHLEDHLGFSVPVAHRTRKCTELHRSKAADTFDAREEKKDLLSARVLKKGQPPKIKMLKLSALRMVERLDQMGLVLQILVQWIIYKKKRSRQENLAGHQAGTQYNGRLTRSRKVAASISLDPSRSNNSSTCNGPALTSLDIQSGKIPLHQTVNNGSSMDAAAQRDSDQAKVGTEPLSNMMRKVMLRNPLTLQKQMTD
ncbi:hypothetical protein DH2020_043294 [Rehmannia glutinosa]|uniref:J domain-containing protein n=1 Tax=Rehmannia glutinosa TaxID=99300 RepID=A0ABR0UL99_REHGL